MSERTRDREIKLDPNVPVTLDVRMARIFRGRDLPAKGGKPARKGSDRLMICGKLAVDVGVEDVVLFVAASALEQLRALEAVEPVDYSPGRVPEGGLRLKITKSRLVFVNEQVAGAQKGVLRISLSGVRVEQRTANTTGTAGATLVVDAGGDARARRKALYEKITAYVLDRVAPMYEARGRKCTPEAIAKIVETLFNAELAKVA